MKKLVSKLYLKYASWKYRYNAKKTLEYIKKYSTPDEFNDGLESVIDDKYTREEVIEAIFAGKRLNFQKFLQTIKEYAFIKEDANFVRDLWTHISKMRLYQ